MRKGQITRDPAQESAVAWLQGLHDALAHPKRGGFFGLFGKPVEARGIYICGDVGRGKSMLMDLFFETAAVKEKRRVHFHAFMQEVHDDIKFWRDLSKQDQKTKLKELGLKGKGTDPIPPVAKKIADAAHLLCFDEFQVTDVADAMILGRLFEALFGFGVIVVATSNRPPHELYEGGLNRQLFLPFIAMLQSKLDIYQLDAATDYRVDRVKGMKVYFTPLGAEADGEMDLAWAAIIGTHGSGPADIRVKGRRLRFARAANGAVRESFQNLCAKNHGPADYLAIAREFHTVFLDGIPKMDKSKRNEAKRFVTLIDALYEHNVNLVASADGEPDDLYPSGDGSFEFGRTASRLKEMQAQDYLSLPHKVEG